MAHACVMKATGRSVQEVCGTLIYVPIFSSATGISPSSLTPWTNLTGAPIAPKVKIVSTGGHWIPASSAYVCRAGQEFVRAVCRTHCSDQWYQGAREGTKECEIITSCLVQHKPRGSERSEVKCGRASNSLQTSRSYPLMAQR